MAEVLDDEMVEPGQEGCSEGAVSGSTYLLEKRMSAYQTNFQIKMLCSLFTPMLSVTLSEHRLSSSSSNLLLPSFFYSHNFPQQSDSSSSVPRAVPKHLINNATIMPSIQDTNAMSNHNNADIVAHDKSALAQDAIGCAQKTDAPQIKDTTVSDTETGFYKSSF